MQDLAAHNPPEGPLDRPVTRRRFITYAGAGTALALVDAGGFLAGPLTQSGDALTLTLLRPADQLRLDFEFLDLAHDVAGNRLVGTGAGSPRMRIGLGSQHTAERPIAGGTVPGGISTAPIGHRAAGPSRLVFDVAPPIALTVAALLDLASLTLRTTATAGDPTGSTTMVELPADLRWSPTAGTRIRSESGPERGGVHQLHRLVVGTEGTTFTPVFNARATDTFPGRVPDASSRDAIVSSAVAEVPATASRMWLSQFGGWADIDGGWTGLSWTQRIQGGRDSFAQVVDVGYLMPFGHPVVWSETNTRVWVADTDGDLVARLVTDEQFSIVGDGELNLPGTHSPFGGRNMPFTSIDLESREPMPATKGQINWTTSGQNPQPRSIDPADAWIIQVADGEMFAGQSVRFAYTGLDRASNPPTTWTLPGVFVRASALDDENVTNRLSAFYESDEGESFRSAILRGNVAWATPDVEDSPLSTLDTTRLEFGVDRIEGASSAELETAGQRRVTPVVRRGVVAKNGKAGIDVVYSASFLAEGNDPDFNPTKTFVDLVTPTAFPLGNEARAVMTPDLVAEQFNQTTGIGPVLESETGGGAATIEWRPELAFGVDAKLLGGVSLADLVLPVLLDVAVAGIDIPELTIEQFPDSIVQTYTWCPKKIESVPAAGFITTSTSKLCVEVETVIALDPSVTPSATVTFEATNFTLLVPPAPLTVLELDVDRVTVVQASDGSTDLTFDIGGWRLGGILSWVQPLFDLLESAGASVNLDVTDTLLDLRLGLTIPGLNLGFLSIEQFNIVLTGVFPYVGDERMSIGIAVGTIDDPISVSIMQFVGGFSCELDFDATGLRRVEIGVFVGCRLFEIDMVLVTAYCEVKLLAEFKWIDGDVTFIGGVDVVGHLSIAGFMGAEVGIRGVAEYDLAAETITMTGTVYWSIDVVGFSDGGSVDIGTIKFYLSSGGGAGSKRLQAAPDLSSGFGDVHTFTTWNQYVAAFAPEA